MSSKRQDLCSKHRTHKAKHSEDPNFEVTEYVSRRRHRPAAPIIILMLNTGESFVASLCRSRKVTNYYYYHHRHPNPHNPHWQDGPNFFFHFWALFLIVRVLCSRPTARHVVSVLVWWGVGLVAPHRVALCCSVRHHIVFTYGYVLSLFLHSLLLQLSNSVLHLKRTTRLNFETRK